MARDILIPHDEIRDPQKITQRNVRAFREAGLDIHRDEVIDIEDDSRRGVRRLKVKGRRTYFDMGKG